MSTFKYDQAEVVELRDAEMAETEGGFIPLIIFGVVYGAPVVAAACGAALLAGVAAGIAIASAIDN